MPDQSETDRIDRVDRVVQEAAVQLWSAAQTEFDPFAVDPSEWHDPVRIRDADIATDTGLDLDDVRAALGRLEGDRLVLGRDGGTTSVQRLVPEDGPP